MSSFDIQKLLDYPKVTGFETIQYHSGGSVVGQLANSFSPLYFVVSQLKEVMSTEQPCDLAYEFGDGLFGLHQYPQGFPRPGWNHSLTLNTVKAKIVPLILLMKIYLPFFVEFALSSNYNVSLTSLFWLHELFSDLQMHCISHDVLLHNFVVLYLRGRLKNL